MKPLNAVLDPRAGKQCMIDIQLNTPFDMQVRVVGSEQTSVIVIDQALESTDSLLEDATQNAQFTTDAQSAYPGVRASLPAEYGACLIPALATLITQVYKIPPDFNFQVIHQLYSLVAKSPQELSVLQRVPHFDTVSPYYFATVHYLQAGTFGGTGLFRHRPTGYESISAARYPAYSQAADAYTKIHGLPELAYINQSDHHFELLEAFEYRHNRLIVYPGNRLHSGLIDPIRDVSPDPGSGRLTANLFLNFTPDFRNSAPKQP